MTAPGTVPPPVTGWWVKRNYIAFPTGATLTLTGSAPFPSGGQRFTPAGASLTLTGSAPTVQVGIPNIRQPSGATLTLTGSAPTVSVNTAAQHYNDDFTRANSTTTLGASWTNRLNAMGIDTNAAYPATSSDCRASYNSIMATDNHSVSILIGSIAGGDNGIQLILGANSAGEAAVLYCTMGTGVASIRTATTWANSPGTSRASVAVTYTTGDTLKLSRTGNVYTATKNGSAIGSGLTWTDSGNILPRDSSHRIVGIGGTNAASSYRRLDSWSADDI